jgi:hypothetical protein
LEDEKEAIILRSATLKLMGGRNVHLMAFIPSHDQSGWSEAMIKRGVEEANGLLPRRLAYAAACRSLPRLLAFAGYVVVANNVSQPDLLHHFADEDGPIPALIISSESS